MSNRPARKRRQHDREVKARNAATRARVRATIGAPEVDEHERRIGAAIDLIGRCGALDVSIRYHDDEPPTVWIAVAAFHVGDDGRPTLGDTNAHRCAAALDPLGALHALLDELIDGGQCTHCERPTGFERSFDPMPLDELFCWYQWDPELGTYRRGCE